VFYMGKKQRESIEGGRGGGKDSASTTFAAQEGTVKSLLRRGKGEKEIMISDESHQAGSHARVVSRELRRREKRDIRAREEKSTVASYPCSSGKKEVLSRCRKGKEGRYRKKSRNFREGDAQKKRRRLAFVRKGKGRAASSDLKGEKKERRRWGGLQ